MKSYIIPISQGVTRSSEKNDCVVRAIANCTGKTYDEVHSLVAKHGRKEGKGTYWDTSLAVMRELGFKCMVFGNTKCASYFSRQLKVFRQESLTLGKAVKQFNQGNYVVFVPGHAVAMQDGKLVDSDYNSTRKQVSAIWYNPND